MSNKKQISVIGTGTWGIALARMLQKDGHDVMAWSAIPAELDALKTTHIHPNLPGVEIPEGIVYTPDIEEACTGKDILVFAVPSVFVRSTAEKAAPYIADGQIIVDVAKGIEADTLMTMTEIIEDVLRTKRPEIRAHLVALSGPTHAEEVARDMPTTIVAASKEADVAASVQQIFSNHRMRVYTNSDVKGVEISAAVKNIMALAAGISAGMGFGDNLKAAIITRGLAEVTRLGKAMGCKASTFAGLAGVGDLIVTATSVHSRNNRAGYLMGQGKSAQEAIKEVGMVVEGINAIPAAMKLKDKYHVEMPITEAVDQVVNHAKAPEKMLHELMTREYTEEIY